MNRRDFLVKVGFGGVAFATASMGRKPAALAQETTENPPNIVLIMADDLGYGHLGCYGQEIIRTPNIDRLSREGMRFIQAYAGCCLCAPSRSVLMTGYHGGHTSVRGNSGGIPLPAQEVTMAEVLQQAGYATGLFGKWGLGDARTEGVPNAQGFDEFFGYLHQKHAHFYYTDYLWHNEEPYPLPGNTDGKREQYSHDIIMEKSLDFIRDRKGEPFFCFLSLTIPHHEWTVPDEALKEYSDEFEESPPRFKWRQGYAFPNEPKANMAAMITHMDKGVGQVMELLEELGIRENTLILFTSDNGADSYSLACPEFFKANGALRGYKGDMYEGGIRVPAVASWPRRIAQGVTDDHVWYFADLMPTFAELAGEKGAVPEEVDGLSFAPTLTGESGQQHHEFLYWEEGRTRAVRMGDWKGVLLGGGQLLELYDLSEDLAEQHDVAERHPEIVARISTVMEDAHRKVPPQKEPDAPDGRQHR